MQIQAKAAKRETITSIMHQKAVAEITTRSRIERRSSSLALSLSILSANRLTFLLKRPPGFLANGNFIRFAQGRDRLVQSGQDFREPAFEFLHPVAQNTDGLVIVFQRIGQAVFLLHPFGCRERRVYF